MSSEETFNLLAILEVQMAACDYASQQLCFLSQAAKLGLATQARMLYKAPLVLSYGKILSISG